MFQALFVIVAMTAIVFVGGNVIGNPVDILINPDATQAARARVIAHYGLDQPLWRQYLLFPRALAPGDFGDTFVYDHPALGLILERLPATPELTISALLLVPVVALPLRIYHGPRPERLAPRIIMAG